MRAGEVWICHGAAVLSLDDTHSGWRRYLLLEAPSDTFRVGEVFDSSGWNTAS